MLSTTEFSLLDIYYSKSKAIASPKSLSITYGNESGI